MRFDECKSCMYEGISNKSNFCATSRLSLAWHNLNKELPVIGKFVDNNKYCKFYQERK